MSYLNLSITESYLVYQSNEIMCLFLVINVIVFAGASDMILLLIKLVDKDDSFKKSKPQNAANVYQSCTVGIALSHVESMNEIWRTQ